MEYIQKIEEKLIQKNEEIDMLKKIIKQQDEEIQDYKNILLYNKIEECLQSPVSSKPSRIQID